MALAIAGADYACALYPAWQVPMGFIILSMMVWILIENDEWKHYQAADWIIFGIDVLFMFSIIARFIWIDMEYITGISETVYPGARVEYGGMSVQKLLGYLYVMFAFIMPQANPCEMSCIAVAFPLGLLLDGYVLYKQRGKNTLLLCLRIIRSGMWRIGKQILMRMKIFTILPSDPRYTAETVTAGFMMKI